MPSINKLSFHAEVANDPKDGSVIYTMTPSQRDSSSRQEVLLKKDSLLQFEFEDNTKWMCDPSTLHELFPEADTAISPKTRSQLQDGFELPGAISPPGADRGIAGTIALKLLKVLAKKSISEGVEALARKLENANLKNGIPDTNKIWKNGFEQQYLNEGAGIFSINRQFDFGSINIKEEQIKKPFFMFIHGTNSDTLGAFNGLKESEVWRSIHEKYGSNVIAFQHRTLTESPLENAVKLAKQLPNDIELHIISHSRGGIIGDILSKYSSDGKKPPKGFTNAHLALLKKEPNRQSDIDNIRELNKIYKTKKIAVTKFIRVGCPAAGTTLASKRLDIVLNVFFNVLGNVTGPVGDVFTKLLSAAIENKNNSEVLPGIEAQSPASPFIKILNDQSEENTISGNALAVIAGNGAIDLSGHGLLVILGKLFFWKRNDLVVDTDSMYLGIKRANEIQYYFDENAEVNHVKYFENKNTLDAIKTAVKNETGTQIPGFKSFDQNKIPSSDRDDRGLQYGALKPASKPPSGQRPIIVLLPGIMGSNLSNGEQKLWLNYFNILGGGLMDLDNAQDGEIVADSVVKTSYERLYDELSSKYDVVIHPFDWRMQLGECASLFEVKIKELMGLGQPIKIIGHSMGGVLVRDFIINHPETWKKLNATKDFRLIFLGSPLEGSYRILTVLFGEDAIINKLSMLDLKHTKRELLSMFSKFEGILSLLPINKDKDAANDFANIRTWENMREVFNKKDWPLPGEDELKRFGAYRNKIIQNRGDIDYSNMVYIAGKDKMTPSGYFKEEILPDKELHFIYTSRGDQSVTWDSIPEQLKTRKAVYYSRTSHGMLASDPDIFSAIEEILSSGSTSLLSKKEFTLRAGEDELFRAAPENDFDMSEQAFENAILGISTEKQSQEEQLSVTVSNGDLHYSSYPVLAGHFLNDGILYAERAIDFYLDGALSAKHKLGLYPGDIGTNSIFEGNEKREFEGGIIVGLGEPGNLTSFQLATTVEQGVSNYLLRIKRKKDPNEKVGITALTIGRGYGGLSVENSLKAIIEGVVHANQKLAALGDDSIRTIEHIEFIELYSNKALSCMYALNKIVTKELLVHNIVIGNKRIKQLLGIRKITPLDSSEDWWNRITIKYKPANEKDDEPASLVFGASTGDSREEENQLYCSTPLIDLFVSEISTANRWSPRTAKTLFELLIPNELKEKLKRKGNISWILDINTASYPWELLQDNTIHAKPLCINAGMIRQLSTSEYRTNIKRASNEGALVIADPILNGFISQLPGAAQEGETVTNVLKKQGYPTTSIIHQNADKIVLDFFSNEYSIIHLAGHGIFNPKSPKKSGMVIGEGLFLTVFEIQQMAVVPDLVFVNCCHLGSTRPEDENYYKNRYKLAANIGTELIKIGVRAVIAAGWAVDDQAALDFADSFYSNMFSGENFGDAVKNARKMIYDRYNIKNNTWGAYQCYGDPFFKFAKRGDSKSSWSPSYIVPQEAEIHLDNLLNQLELGSKSKKDNLEELQIITKAVDKAEFKTAEIIERQGKIYYELGLYKKAISKFNELLLMEKANFSFACISISLNAGTKLIIENLYAKDRKNKPKIEEIADANEKMNKLIMEIMFVHQMGETAERASMIGSAYKRFAMTAGSAEKLVDAYSNATKYYVKACELSKQKHIIYPLINAIEIYCLMVISGHYPKTLLEITYKEIAYQLNDTNNIHKLVKVLEEEFSTKKKENQNYWEMVYNINIKVCSLLLSYEEKVENEQWDQIKKAYKDLWLVAGSDGKKEAELQHIHFLTYAFTMARHAEGNANGLPMDGYVNCTGDLDTQINELTNAYSKLFSAKERAKIKSKGKSTTVDKTKKINKNVTLLAKKDILNPSKLN